MKFTITMFSSFSVKEIHFDTQRDPHTLRSSGMTDEIKQTVHRVCPTCGGPTREVIGGTYTNAMVSPENFKGLPGPVDVTAPVVGAGDWQAWFARYPGHYMYGNCMSHPPSCDRGCLNDRPMPGLPEWPLFHREECDCLRCVFSRKSGAR